VPQHDDPGKRTLCEVLSDRACHSADTARHQEFHVILLLR